MEFNAQDEFAQIRKELLEIRKLLAQILANSSADQEETLPDEKLQQKFKED